MNRKLFGLALVLAVTGLNPVTESAEFHSATVYMLSHYVVVASGFIFGYTILRSDWKFAVIGVIPVVFWHLPLPFSLGAGVLKFRILLDTSLFLGGFLLGSSIRSLPQWSKITLFALYMLGDTLLSILLLIGSPEYSNKVYPFSPYTPESLPLAGISMIIVMNVILATVIYIAFRSVLKGL
ncbi:DUF1404 domain-containing protein [Metallosphaera javensis (ex Sakai et al. 2022)]|uniref:DUF1404 domain-containing protein n=1 Tax=Metallosphaera javensis (ex Sakai et al. 2022) TaxID=2775498 RepID=UPI00258B2E22|nr:MAG: hypothetical protein MjAS7_0991 [Metallosphaera javensis (ex Sakai et al. 2022)]